MFNHQARWDRKLPLEDASMLGARIAVFCLMENGRILPKAFTRNNKTCAIHTVNFSWKDRQGRFRLTFFSVKTEEGTYQIVFSESTLTWHLNKLLGP